MGICHNQAIKTENIILHRNICEIIIKYESNKKLMRKINVHQTIFAFPEKNY